MFEEYIGKHLSIRHKAIGLKYAEKHGFPELISKSTYGILFKNDGKNFLVFRVFFEGKALYDRKGKHMPGRTEKTITDVSFFGEGYTQEEYDEAEKI